MTLRQIKIFIRYTAATALLPLILIACRSASNEDGAPTEVADYTDLAWEWADSVVTAMSEPELAGQVIMPAIYATADSTNLQLLRHYTDSLHLGGILLLKGDTASTRIISASLRNNSSTLPLLAIDAEWGLGMRLADAPSYTPFGNLPDSISDMQLYDYGYEIGRQAPRLGINVVFAPVMDVISGVHSAIGFRSLGADPQRVANLGTAFARGLEDGNVISVAKHFPGLGASDIDSHKAQPKIDRDINLLNSIDLYPFAKYIEQDLSGIMISHAYYPALDSIERSACVSPSVQTDLLRQRMGFEGLIFTDALNMRGLGSVSQPTVQALLAGANIVVAPDDTDRAISEILTALQNGTLPLQILRERVRRILFYKYSL